MPLLLLPNTAMASKLSVRKRQHGPSHAARATIKQCRAQLHELLQIEEEGRRVISPRSEKIVLDLIHRMDDHIENPDFRKQTKFAREMTTKVSEMHDRIKTDKAYEPAFRKLEELLEVQFHLRYSDYLAIYASHMSKTARDLKKNSDYEISSSKSTYDESDSGLDELKPAYDGLKPTDDLKPAPNAIENEAWQFFLRESWSAIYERLLDESVFITGKQCPDDPIASRNVPLVRLLQMVAMLTKQDTLDVARAIGAFVNNRNAAELQRYIKKKDSLQIAAYLSKDLEALSEPPRNCAKNVAIIKTAILFVSQLYFKDFRWDDKLQMVISYTDDPAIVESRSSTA